VVARLGAVPAAWLDNGDGTLTAPDGSGGWIDNGDGTFTGSVVDGLRNVIVYTVDATLTTLRTLTIPPSSPSEVSGPMVVAFDPALPYAEHLADNRGCPDGYFAQYVEPNGVDYQPPGKSYALRCRLIATSTAETIQEESAAPFWVNAALNFDQGVRTLGGGLAAAAGAGLQVLAPWLIGGAVLLVFLVWKK
jgi:hypothetical protein